MKEGEHYLDEAYENFQRAFMEALDKAGEALCENTIDKIITDQNLRDKAKAEFKRSWKSAFLLYGLYELREWWEKNTETYKREGVPIPVNLYVILMGKAVIELGPWWQLRVINIAYDIVDSVLKAYPVQFNTVYGTDDFGRTYGSDGSVSDLVDYTSPNVNQNVIQTDISGAVNNGASSGDGGFTSTDFQSLSWSASEEVAANAGETSNAAVSASPWNSYLQKYGGITGLGTAVPGANNNSMGFWSSLLNDGDAAKAINKTKDTATKVTSIAQEAWDKIKGSVEDHLTKMLNGTESFSSGFRNIFKTMVNEVIQEYVKLKILEPMKTVFTGFIKNLFQADGGPVTANQPYIVGEVGPELFVPSSAGTIIPNDKLAVGQSQPVTVNVINKTGVQATAQANTSFDGQRYIVDVVLDAYARNVGGMRNVLAARR
jgi:hypothetical protein